MYNPTRFGVCLVILRGVLHCFHNTLKSKSKSVVFSLPENLDRSLVDQREGVVSKEVKNPLPLPRIE
jgi:hypothetical protein